MFKVESSMLNVGSWTFLFDFCFPWPVKSFAYFTGLLSQFLLLIWLLSQFQRLIAALWLQLITDNRAATLSRRIIVTKIRWFL